MSAALVVFHALGLRSEAQLTGAWTWARMIGSLAESLAVQGLDMRTYPLRLPHYDYVEGGLDDDTAPAGRPEP
ncbi:hypothetical protein DB30_05605 [Enhygromyxa salina]|uniref:Uncharacterized protein n=1 Tax=Enhygromyxa salina TaxID=215803 RepID=A0A0C1ZCI7_9BACT|nr:hypothetical protein DB30_05605 [Enhygromyxa salina]